MTCDHPVMTPPTPCPRCRTAVPPGRRFCLSCGYDLDLGRQTREVVTLREWMVAEGRLPASRSVIGRSSDRFTRRRLVGVAMAAFSVLGLSVGIREDILGLPLAGDRSDERVNSGGSDSVATPTSAQND